MARADPGTRTKDGGSVKFSVDIELTNRCNAKCHFCPRDQTPHEGTMSPDVFTQSLHRAAEYRDLARELLDGSSVGISLCGLGEPLLNRHAPDFVQQVCDDGFDVSMSSNGALLNEARGTRLLDAGLKRILINVGEEGDDYEDVYKLSFEKTRDNVVRFAEMAQGRCEVHVVLVDHRRDTAHIEKMKAFWKQYGITSFYTYGVMNRGGALFVDHMQFETYPELAEAREMLGVSAGTPLCGAPFIYLFIGYDGQYYLCCSDWKKETPMGSVFDESFRSVMDKKMQYVVTREPVCKTCNLDPLNMVTEELRAVGDGQSDADGVEQAVQAVIDGNAAVHSIIDPFGVVVPAPKPRAGRRSIPVRVTT
jgi:MoaA/NifB/PqqE/SkfB family radical SAM enzyme